MAGSVKPVNAADLDNEFASKTVRYRGHKYTVRELSMKAYDKTVKQATEKDEESGVERYNAEAHNRLLLARTVTEDDKPVDVDDLYDRGSRIVRSLMSIITSLHFDDEPEEEEPDVEEGEVSAEAPKLASAS